MVHRHRNQENPYCYLTQYTLYKEKDSPSSDVSVPFLPACMHACLSTHSLHPARRKHRNHRFVLFRDDGVAGNLLETAAAAAAARGNGSSSSGGSSGVSPPRASTTVSTTSASAARTTLASFKGCANGCEVAGLSPNTLYHFRVRAVNARTRSSLSPPLEVCA